MSGGIVDDGGEGALMLDAGGATGEQRVSQRRPVMTVTAYRLGYNYAPSCPQGFGPFPKQPVSAARSGVHKRRLALLSSFWILALR